jgi:hypothetical protein
VRGHVRVDFGEAGLVRKFDDGHGRSACIQTHRRVKAEQYGRVDTGGEDPVSGSSGRREPTAFRPGHRDAHQIRHGEHPERITREVMSRDVKPLQIRCQLFYL